MLVFIYMSNIFKIYINNNNNLTNLYLFIKNKYLSNSLDKPIHELQSEYQNSKHFINSELFYTTFKDDFSDLDMKYIQDFNVSIYFIDENIYYDDTLEIIKFKFLKYYNNSIDISKQISYEELYMYGLINKKYNPSELYNILSDNNSNKITNENMKQYLLNINEQIEFYNKLLEANKNIEQNFYNYDDINSIILDEINILTPIGQNINNKLPHLYTTNPFHVNKYSNFIRSIINTSLNTNNNNLLFEYNIVNNTLFVCLFNDVLNYSKQLSPPLEEDITIKLYFPLIASNHLNTYQLFIENKKDFLDKTTKHIKNDVFNSKNTFVNTLYYIHNNSKNYPEINYSTNAIKNISLNIYSNINVSLTLESLFKIINSNANIPFIKYNPGKKHENIYRLYCNKKNKQNAKIPFLSKDIIIKYSKIMGRSNTISMVILNNDAFAKNNIKLFLLEIDIYGTINIKLDVVNNINIKEINSIIQENVNPVIDIIKTYINNNSNLTRPFNTLMDDNVEVINLNYIIKINSKLSIKLLNNIKNCLYFFFNIISDKTKEKIYRYKRVSNYNEMSAYDAFITELIKQKESPNKIIELLKDNFKLASYEEAVKIFESTIESLNIIQNNFNYRKLKIKNSPGFLFKIDNNINNEINISIDNIDNIRYIYYIKLYIDSIFKMSFNDDVELIKSICKSSNKNNEQFLDDIVNTEIPNELTQKNIGEILNSEHHVDIDDIIDATSSIGDEEDSDNLLNLLFNNTDDEDDDDNDDDDEYDKLDDYVDKDSISFKSNNLIDLTQKKIKSIDSDEDDDDDDDDDDDNNEQDKPIQDKPIQDKSIQDKPIQDNDNTEKFKNFKESTRGNPILNRLEKIQPELFKVKTYKPNLAKENTGKNYVSYSRLCQSARQPVILNEEEKQKVLLDNPEYTNKNILEYSTDTSEKHYYLCPKFWDLENNKTLTDTEVKSGNHGTLYNKGKGNIYKFENKDREPAFLKDIVKDQNGNEFCLPCCFSKLKNNKTTTEETGKRVCNVKTQTIKHGDIKYIIRSDKFPLEQYKAGHLPVNVKKFLQFDSDECIHPANNNNLKFKYTCLLRYGVQNDKNNSFISCIADAYSKEILKTNTSIGIDKMINIIVESLNIDNFITYNNGNLVEIFLDKNITQESMDAFKINNLENTSKFYNQLDKSNYNHINLYKRILISFENFKSYLKGKNYVIDYTYLWDIICKPNTLLFPNGINLIILDITSHDLTDNVKVICPKQNYSNEFVDDNKKSLILLMKHEYFEPIYSIIKSDTSHIITPLFSFTIKSNETRLYEFKKVLNFIREDINNTCMEDNSSKKVEFNKNISLENIINILNKLGHEINFQVMDYENKVIAVIISNHKDYDGYRYVPCYPSKLYDDYEIPIKFIDELNKEYFADYKLTKDFLHKLYKSTNQIIPCDPLYKIMENGMVIGILTNSNQFVMISRPEIYVKDDLEELSDKNYLFADITIQTKFNIDNERKEMINNIKLESGFYNTFRNTILKLLLEYKNYKYNIKIQDIIKNNSLIYFDKLKIIREELESLAKNYISFAKYDKNILNNIKNFSICNNNGNCDTEFCMINNSTNICNLIIPKLNLITNDNNYDIYFTKLSDEFTRYNKTKLILFNPANVISFNNIKYNIKDDEIILMESTLVKEIITNNFQFKDPFSNYNTFDTNNIDYNNKVNKIDTSKINVQYNDFEIDTIQNNEKVVLKLPKEKVEQIKMLEKKYKQNIHKFTDEDIPDADEDIAPQEKTELSINDYIKDVQCEHSNNAVKEVGLRSLFTNKISELFFHINKNKICSFELLLFILKHSYSSSGKTNILNLSVNQLKNILIEEYFNHEYTESLIYLMKEINPKLKNTKLNNHAEMQKLMDKLNTSPFLKTDEFKELISNVINSSDFLVGYLDIYLIAKKFDLPIIVICNSIINLSIDDNTFIILNKNTQKNNNYYFIKIPSQYNRNLKNYKLLYFVPDNLNTNTNTITIDIAENLIDNDKLSFKQDILLGVENYQDRILEYFIKYNINKIVPKNNKLAKKNKY